MTIRKCEKCGKTFDKKYNFDVHMKKKYDCQTGILKPDDVHQCNQNHHNHIFQLRDVHWRLCCL
jgi:hypothetical protein